MRLKPDKGKSTQGPGAPKALVVLGVALVLLVAGLVLALRSLTPDTRGEEVGLEVVKQQVADGTISRATFHDQDARLLLETEDGSMLWTALPRNGQASELLDQVAESGAPVIVDQQWGKQLLTLLAQFILPLLLLAVLFGIFILLARGGASQVRELFAFSRLGAKSTRPEGPQVTFADVASLDDTILELAEIRDYLSDPRRFVEVGARPPKGVLLYGPPGCGKTLLARALAGEADVPFFSISGSEFVESLVGVGAARMRDLFAQAKTHAPAIIFVDELDAAGRKRGAGVGGGHDEREQTLNELLVQMDGFAPNLGIVVVGATNRPDILDPALLRPGRFDRHVVVEAPDVRGRLEILRLHAAQGRMGKGASLEQVAEASPGFTGADLANVINEAALLAVRRRSRTISGTDLQEAVQRVQYGPKRRGRLLTDDELERLAYHEAGHVVVAREVGFPGEIHQVSIVARGRNGAQCEVLHSDRAILTRSQLISEMAIALGGLAAEEIQAGEGSTASEKDIERATDLARQFAGRYGMAPQVGRMRVLQRDEEVFLGRDYLAAQNLSTQTLQLVDDAVRELLDDAERQALEILQKGRRQLDRLAEALVEEETIAGSRLKALLEGERRSSRQRKRSGTKKRAEG